MSQSVNGTNVSLLRISRSLADYSEIIIILMVLALLFMSFDEILEFIAILRDTFVYRSPPICP